MSKTKKYTPEQIKKLIRKEVIEELGDNKEAKRLSDYYAKKFIRKLDKVKDE